MLGYYLHFYRIQVFNCPSAVVFNKKQVCAGVFSKKYCLKNKAPSISRFTDGCQPKNQGWAIPFFQNQIAVRTVFCQNIIITSATN